MKVGCMIPQRGVLGRLCMLVAVFGLGTSVAPAGGADYEARSTGLRLLEKNDVMIKILVDASNLGGTELEIAEITIPVSYGRGGAHHHGATEIFYVLSGTLGHTVNGTRHLLTPGTVGIVRPEDTVAHSVESTEPVKALVIWLPAGESARLVTEFGYTARPLE